MANRPVDLPVYANLPIQSPSSFRAMLGSNTPPIGVGEHPRVQWFMGVKMKLGCSPTWNNPVLLNILVTGICPS